MEFTHLSLLPFVGCRMSSLEPSTTTKISVLLVVPSQMAVRRFTGISTMRWFNVISGRGLDSERSRAGSQGWRCVCRKAASRTSL